MRALASHSCSHMLLDRSETREICSHLHQSISVSINTMRANIHPDEPNIFLLHSSLSEDAPSLVDIPLNLTGARGKPEVSQGYTKGFDRRFNTWLTPYPPWSPHFHFLFLCPPMFTSRTWLGKLLCSTFRSARVTSGGGKRIHTWRVIQRRLNRPWGRAMLRVHTYPVLFGDVYCSGCGGRGGKGVEEREMEGVSMVLALFYKWMP